MTVTDVVQIVAALLLVLGSLFAVIAGLGVLRLPDLYTRMHAASKAGVVGAGLILLGVAFVALDYPVILRSVLGILFLLLTTPVSAHLLARSAYRAGVKPVSKTNINELDTDIYR
jgi:multicomponent Na+:H+ antiporter subunit G